MTRKDYVLIASVLKSCMPVLQIPAAQQTWRETVYTMANALALDNPRFDKSRFADACGLV